MLRSSRFHLHSVHQYAALLSAAGLQILTSEDATAEFILCMEREQSNLDASKDRFLQTYNDDDYVYLSTRWEKKLKFCRDGEFRWGLFIARKP